MMIELYTYMTWEYSIYFNLNCLLHRNKVLWTPLDCAAANGHARVIKELVSAKAEIEPTDKLKITPLHLAAKEGHVTAVETLIKHGANIGLRDQRGFNALDWAIEKGHRYDINLKETYIEY